MDSFAVLVALDQGWPLETMCLENFHYNAKVGSFFFKATLARVCLYIPSVVCMHFASFCLMCKDNNHLFYLCVNLLTSNHILNY